MLWVSGGKVVRRLGTGIGRSGMLGGQQAWTLQVVGQHLWKVRAGKCVVLQGLDSEAGGTLESGDTLESA